MPVARSSPLSLNINVHLLGVMVGRSKKPRTPLDADMTLTQTCSVRNHSSATESWHHLQRIRAHIDDELQKRTFPFLTHIMQYSHAISFPQNVRKEAQLQQPRLDPAISLIMESSWRLLLLFHHWLPLASWCTNLSFRVLSLLLIIIC